MRNGLRIVAVAALAGCGSGDKASDDAGAGPTTVTSHDGRGANWTGTWVPGASHVTSTVGDLGRWVRGYGSVLSARSRRLQTAPDLAGKGPLTRSNYYGFGTLVTNGWIAQNPQLAGYNGIAAYLPSKKLSFVAFTTLGATTNPVVAAATAVFRKVAHALTPENIPAFSVLPRGTSGNQ